MSGERPVPTTAAGLLDEALGGRARLVQARIVDRMSRADVRELALAIDEAIVWAVGSYAARVAEFGAKREQDLRDLVAERKKAAGGGRRA